jgi:hypothetical protein
MRNAILTGIAACMEPDELALLRKASRRRQHTVEFGCGASTLLLLQNGVGALDSVDSQPAWVRRVSAEPDAAEALRTGRLRMHCIDIGPTRKWGHPLGEESKARWPQYAQAVWQDALPAPVDFVLIDGRFRVACALMALLKARPDALVAIHDFWTRLGAYGEILALFDVVERAASLAILAPRQDLDQARLETLLRQYSSDPA